MAVSFTHNFKTTKLMVRATMRTSIEQFLKFWTQLKVSHRVKLANLRMVDFINSVLLNWLMARNLKDNILMVDQMDKGKYFIRTLLYQAVAWLNKLSILVIFQLEEEKEKELCIGQMEAFFKEFGIMIKDTLAEWSCKMVSFIRVNSKMIW